MSDYPERPQHGKRPSRPGKAPNRPSSEKSTKKSRTWIDRTATGEPTGPRPKEAKLDSGLIRLGHDVGNFLKKYRNNFVPIHYFGKKGRS